MTAGSQSGVPLIGVESSGVQGHNVPGHNVQFGASPNFLTTAGELNFIYHQIY